MPRPRVTIWQQSPMRLATAASTETKEAAKGRLELQLELENSADHYLIPLLRL